MALLHQFDTCSEIIPSLRFHFQGLVGMHGSVPGGGKIPYKIARDFCSSKCLNDWINKNHIPDCWETGSTYICGTANIAILSQEISDEANE